MEWMPMVCGVVLMAFAFAVRWQDVKSINAIKALWDEDRQRMETRIQTEWQRARAEVNLMSDKLEAARESQAHYLADTNRTIAAMKIARGQKSEPQDVRPRVRPTNGQAERPMALQQDGMD